MLGTREERRVTRAAAVVGLATLASRVGGFVRDAVIAYYFGTSPATDAFFVAWRLPNLLRRLLAEGALAVAFVPVFTSVLEREGRGAARVLLRATSGVVLVGGAVVAGLGIIWAEWVVKAIAPGFVDHPQTLELAVELARWCLPYIVFISLVALAGGALNSMGHFLAPAAAPAILNLCFIAAAVALAPVMGIKALVVGVVVGGVGQVLMQLPWLRAYGLSLWPVWAPSNPHLRRVGRLMLPAAFGAAVYQLAIFANTILASLLAPGAISYLYYADRLIQFPLGVFTVALGTAILPSLSRQAAASSPRELVQTLGYGLRLTGFVIIPAMVGLIVLARPVVELLFARGRFTTASAGATAAALVAYAAGLWAVAGVRIVVQAFYAMHDTRRPMIVASVALGVNVLAGIVLMRWMGHVGLALATSIAAAVNLVGLVVWLGRRVGLGGLGVMGSLLKSTVLSLVMAGVVWAVAYGVAWEELGGIWARAGQVLGGIGAGAGWYLLGAWVWRMDEPRQVLEALRRRR